MEKELETHLQSLEVDAAAHRGGDESSDGEDSEEYERETLGVLPKDDAAKAAVSGYEDALRQLGYDIQQLMKRTENAALSERLSTLREAVPQLIISLAAHSGRHYWTSSSSRQLATGLLLKVLRLCGCSSTLELLIGRSASYDSYATSHDSHMTSPYAPVAASTTAEPSNMSQHRESNLPSHSNVSPPTSHDSHMTSPYISPPSPELKSSHKAVLTSEPNSDDNLRVEEDPRCEEDNESGASSEEGRERVMVFSSGVIKPLLSLLRSKLTKETWKRHPTAKHALIWTLAQLKHPHVSPYLPSLLPPLLMLLDDHESYHKTLGLSAVTHLIKNMDPTELRWYGRAEVIYEAIKNMLYIREAAIIHSLHTCLVCLLPVLEGPPPITVTAPRKPLKTDEVFRILLNNLDFESKIALRKAYVVHLSSYIALLGIYTARHVKQVLKVLAVCLEYPDYSGEKTRLLALRSLLTLMKHTWPRMPSHKDEILKMLLRLVSDLCPEDDSIPEKTEVTAQLKLVSECMVMLLRCCGNMEGTYRSLQQSCVHRGLLSCLETSLAGMELRQS